MASSSATGPSATPVVAATIATSSELSVSTQEDDNEDGEDIDIDIDIDVNSNKVFSYFMIFVLMNSY